MEKGSGEVIGLAVANRGPLGLNFSFLENRLDLLLSNKLDIKRGQHVSTVLLAETAEFFRSVQLDSIPIVVKASFKPSPAAIGGNIYPRLFANTYLQ